MDDKRIEITEEQCETLGNTILFRLEYLALQPRSVERDDEIRTLQLLCRMIYNKIKQIATQEEQAMITPIRAKYQSVRELAQNLGFDMHRVPAKYFVLCDWYRQLVKMFDDTPMGDDEAIEWMKEQKNASI